MFSLLRASRTKPDGSGQRGRINFLLLTAFVLLIAGLSFGQWWWQIGALILLAFFLHAYFKYRMLD